MTCPRCSYENAEGPACPRCGVVFSKIAGRVERRAVPRVEAAAAPEPASGSLPSLSTILVVLAIIGSTYMAWRSTRPAPGIPARTPAAPQGTVPRSAAEADVPPPPMPVVTPPPLTPGALTDAAVETVDRARAAALAQRITDRAPLGQADADLAEQLFARYPAEPATADLLEAVLLVLGSAQAEARHYPEAATRLERAALVQPRSTRGLTLLAQMWVNAGDWMRAESAARQAIGRNAQEALTQQLLGYALMRQDRDREAEEALAASLQLLDDPGTRALLERVRHGMAAENGMTAQNISHFHVRYNGAEHAEVGREILQALERHYAALAVTFDDQPAQPIVVLLFTQEAYYDASGAPAWSGGAYDLTDGRVRIPIGGLTSSLSPEMDSTLRHELTHAFAWDRSKGVAPREVQEGLAQRMEGKRVESELSADQLRALADGRGRGVHAFYLSALAFVEYLYDQRGQGGINDLLTAMGETQDVDEGFRRVYGDDFASVRRAWQHRFKQQHGS